jgi:hypothetical protein
VVSIFKGVIKSLKNCLKMAQNSSDLSKDRGENAFFGARVWVVFARRGSHWKGSPMVRLFWFCSRSLGVAASAQNASPQFDE